MSKKTRKNRNKNRNKNKKTKLIAKEVSVNEEKPNNNDNDNQQNKDNNLIKEISNPKILINDFGNFINQYAIISLALGVVIGNLTQGTVRALVDGLITPLINVILKIFFANFAQISEWTFVVMDDIAFKPGVIIKAFLEFIIILFIIFITFKKILNKPELIEKKK